MPSLAVPPPRPTPTLRVLSAFFAALPPKAYAGAALAAIALAIVANATLLQRGRPVQTAAAESSAVTKTPAPTVAVQAPAVSEPAQAPAAASPAARTAAPAVASAPASQAPDPIADLLNGGAAAKDDRKLVASAQAALVKLGYPVKVDGEADAATQQALADFRKKHGLAAGGPIDARLVKTLNAAAGAAAR